MRKLVKLRPQLSLHVNKMSLHVNIRLNYQQNLNKWKVEVKIKSDWLRRELFSVQSKWIKVKISMS